MRKILHTENLDIGYRSRKVSVSVVAGINISLNEGMMVGIAGVNGVGKSTLLRTLTGMQPPLSGKVLLGGKLLQEYTALDLAQRISVVLTDKLPPGNLTVYEIIALGRQPYTNWLGSLSPEDILKINDAIALADVAELLHKKHFEISDGQLQRVMIARALAQDTPIIILDEPTTHLDLPRKIRLFSLLKKLAAGGKCILFSTHDIELAAEFSDEMIVMASKELVQGSPENLIAAGVFNRLFEEEGIRFDPEKGRFTTNPF